MANTITMTNEILAQQVFNAFTAMITPLSAFSTSFNGEAAARGDNIKVPYVPAQGTAAAAFAGTYTMQDSEAQFVQIDLDQHYFTSWVLTDTELANMDALSLDIFVTQKASELAKAVLNNVWGEILAANYSLVDVVGAASTFDYPAVVDIRTLCATNHWDPNNRALIVGEAYTGNLLKEPILSQVNQSGSSGALREGEVGRIAGFNTFESVLIPDNGENLVGFAVHPEALYIGMRYLDPGSRGRQTYTGARRFVNEAGMVLGMREWYDPDAGENRTVLEGLFGKKTGNGEALIRLTSV